MVDPKYGEVPQVPDLSTYSHHVPADQQADLTGDQMTIPMITTTAAQPGALPLSVDGLPMVGCTLKNITRLTPEIIEEKLVDINILVFDKPIYALSHQEAVDQALVVVEIPYINNQSTILTNTVYHKYDTDDSDTEDEEREEGTDSNKYNSLLDEELNSIISHKEWHLVSAGGGIIAAGTGLVVSEVIEPEE
ncbi:hypothetical protein ACTFIV_007903 [Dictyostelium citrinum]